MISLNLITRKVTMNKKIAIVATAAMISVTPSVGFILWLQYGHLNPEASSVALILLLCATLGMPMVNVFMSVIEFIVKNAPAIIGGAFLAWVCLSLMALKC